MTKTINDAEMVQSLSDQAERKLAKTRGSGCVRKRRHDKRKGVLKFYFEQIANGRDMWKHVAVIYKSAPALTERVAKEIGVTDSVFEKCNALDKATS